MIENKIRSVDDSTCDRGCPQLWQGECRAFQMPQTTAERLHRAIPYPIMNCAVPSPRSRVRSTEPELHATEEECMTVGFLHGAGMPYVRIIETLVDEENWSRDRATQICEYLRTVDASFGEA